MSNYSKLLVSVQFLCFAYFIFAGSIFCDGNLLLLQFFGILVSAWGIFTLKIGNFNIQPEVRQNAKFIRSGPYRWIRNPMYLGLLLFFGAIVIQTPRTLNIATFLLLFLVFILKIIKEETYLEDLFGKSYTEYKKRTYRLIPHVF